MGVMTVFCLFAVIVVSWSECFIVPHPAKVTA